MPNINTNTEKIYIVKVPSDNLSLTYNTDRLKQFIYSFTQSRTVDACLDEDNCLGNYPIVSCESSTPKIVIQEGNETKSYKDQNCIFLQANSSKDLSKMTERATYKILEIMD